MDEVDEADEADEVDEGDKGNEGSNVIEVGEIGGGFLSVEFAAWDRLVREYVDNRGRVNYQCWQKEQPDAIAAWLSSFPDQLPALNQNEQLALWINLYNAFTIQRVLQRYPIASIRPTILGLPNWIAFLWFFSQPQHSIFNQRYSLAQIENQKLRDQTQDCRIHFAIVCASIGCPLLRNEAYFPERVQQQLEEDAIRFIHNPEKVRYDADQNVLYCSKIFKWYQKDFLKASPSLSDYISGYLQRSLSPSKIIYLPYDWSLNQRISS